MTRTLAIFAAVAALVVPAGVASAAVSAESPAQSLTYVMNNTMVSGFAVDTQPTNGIIMRPGGVCDPIRHMGC